MLRTKCALHSNYLGSRSCHFYSSSFVPGWLFCKPPRFLFFFFEKRIKEGWEVGRDGKIETGCQVTTQMNRGNHGRDVTAPTIAAGLATATGYLVVPNPLLPMAVWFVSAAVCPVA